MLKNFKTKYSKNMKKKLRILLKIVRLLLLLTILVLSFIILQYSVIQLAFKVNSGNFRLKGRDELKVIRNNKVMFLKTHKTASSTVTSILNRFADLNNLEIALPLDEQTRFDWPEPFQVKSVDITRLKTGRANILCNHAVFSSKFELQKVLYQNTKYLTILRDPVDRFESLFFYEKFNKLFMLNSTKNPLLEALNETKIEYLKRNMTNEQQTIYSKLFFNGMIYDLTAKETKTYDVDDMKHLIKEVEENFDFVMIAEYFDEGIVLLRQLFGWMFIDLVYEKQNVRRSRHVELLTPQVRAKILASNKADLMLYEHFKELFKKRMLAYGDSFERHLEIFKELNNIVNDQCKRKNYTMFMLKDLKVKMDEMDVTKAEMELVGNLDDLSNCFCVKLHRRETSYVQFFQEKFQTYYYLKKNYDYIEKC